VKLAINVVDAFTDVSFKGNSAAVIITDDWLPDELMQSIAIENNLSETAFVKQLTNTHFEIRWFSPITEIDFCGHATLAAASVIFANDSETNSISFYAAAVGTLTIVKGNDSYIEMNFPNRKPEPVSDIPADLLAGLSITPKQVLKNEQAYFAVFDNEQDVMAVRQQQHHIKQLAPYDVVVTAPSTEYDFVSRYFWPASGGDEDPVTGSIHTGLAPYWAEQLAKTSLNAYQASKRGGFLKCRVEGDRVTISGQTVHYLQGEITV